MQAQRGDHVRTQGSCLQLWPNLRRNQSCQHLNLRFPASKTVRKCISVGLATWCVVLCYGSLSPYVHLP